MQPVKDGIRKALRKARQRHELHAVILDLSPVVGACRQGLCLPVIILMRWQQIFAHGARSWSACYLHHQPGNGCPPMDSLPHHHVPLTAADMDATAVHFLNGFVDELRAEGLDLALANPSQQVGAASW